MNDGQRRLVVWSLIAIGIALVFVMLQWNSQYGELNLTSVWVFYKSRNPEYRNLIDEWGIYTRYGVVGVILGIVAPLCLFATAAYIALGKR